MIIKAPTPTTPVTPAAEPAVVHPACIYDASAIVRGEMPMSSFLRAAGLPSVTITGDEHQNGYLESLLEPDQQIPVFTEAPWLLNWSATLADEQAVRDKKPGHHLVLRRIIAQSVGEVLNQMVQLVARPKDWPPRLRYRFLVTCHQELAELLDTYDATFPSETGLAPTPPAPRPAPAPEPEPEDQTDEPELPSEDWDGTGIPHAVVAAEYLLAGHQPPEGNLWHDQVWNVDPADLHPARLSFEWNRLVSIEIDDDKPFLADPALRKKAIAMALNEVLQDVYGRPEGDLGNLLYLESIQHVRRRMPIMLLGLWHKEHLGGGR